MEYTAVSDAGGTTPSSVLIAAQTPRLLPMYSSSSWWVLRRVSGTRSAGESERLEGGRGEWSGSDLGARAVAGLHRLEHRSVERHLVAVDDRAADGGQLDAREQVGVARRNYTILGRVELGAEADDLLDGRAAELAAAERRAGLRRGLEQLDQIELVAVLRPSSHQKTSAEGRARAGLAPYHNGVVVVEGRRLRAGRQHLGQTGDLRLEARGHEL